MNINNAKYELHEDALQLLSSIEFVDDKITVKHRHTRESSLIRATIQEIEIPKIIDSLTDEFYFHHYAASGKIPPFHGQYPDRKEFIQELIRRNGRHDTWDENWKIASTESDSLIVQKHNCLFRCHSDDVRNVRDLYGDIYCSVRVPSELRSLIPGYFTVSNSWIGGSAGARIVRFYLNLSVATVPYIFEYLTRRMRSIDAPFRFKVLSNPREFVRCDAGVLYVPDSILSEILPILTDCLQEFGESLREDVPLFTKKLAPGLSWAIDPGTGTSFGRHRCRIIAEAVCVAFKTKVPTHEQFHLVLSAFLRAGVDPRRPYRPLNYVDSALNHWKVEQKSTASAQVVDRPKSETDSRKREFSRTAETVANWLVDTALWHEGRCTWLTRTVEGGYESRQTIVSTLDLTLYKGLTGVALFLAVAYRSFADERYRSAAIGTLRQIEASVKTMPPKDGDIGIFSGLFGVHAIGSYAWALLEEPQRSLYHGEKALKHAIASISSPLEALNGVAGTILGLLTLLPTQLKSVAIDRASSLGRYVLHHAKYEQNGVSWDVTRMNGERMSCRPLTGFSHGIAGIVHALWFLREVTLKEDFGEVARLALDYENSLHDQRVGNWPDFRLMPHNKTNIDEEVRFGASWCHGAPGISIPRVAMEAHNDHRYTRSTMAAEALNVTRRTLSDAMRQPGVDSTLCHGLLGLVDILYFGGYNLRDNSLVDCAIDSAAGLCVRYRSPETWPTGIAGGGPMPGLMTGLSGVGMQCLRLLGCTHAPSLLCWEPLRA
ncbi:lanthionine synthetase C-like family protein [Burkholderia pseudomallei MSHR4377]|uniref:lanthionine synthetase LanC family protein n=1 Tax=Burkholderia pseudomallei TaxID=28450 RepID=UPI000536F53E|nr:lanthionine synthetase LanC family protein [Burkholderia pseudomallei]KGU92799.1 lanthionine synthetase C-like family protein [Burkholderia pseudomallei MSHR4377]